MSFSTLSICVVRGAAALLAVLLVLPGKQAATAEEAAVATRYSLTDAFSSYQVSTGCPKEGMVLFFTVNYTKPGVLFDTCGLGVAREGDWTLSLGGDGSLSFALYSPGVMTKRSAENGWLTLTSEGVLEPGEEQGVIIIINGPVYQLALYGTDGGASTEEDQLPCRLHDSPVFAGDFPNDEWLGPEHNIHRSAIAEIGVIYFGPVIDEFTEENMAKSWILPVPVKAAE